METGKKEQQEQLTRSVSVQYIQPASMHGESGPKSSASPRSATRINSAHNVSGSPMLASQNSQELNSEMQKRRDEMNLDAKLLSSNSNVATERVTPTSERPAEDAIEMMKQSIKVESDKRLSVYSQQFEQIQSQLLAAGPGNRRDSNLADLDYAQVIREMKTSIDFDNYNETENLQRIEDSLKTGVRGRPQRNAGLMKIEEQETEEFPDRDPYEALQRQHLSSHSIRQSAQLIENVPSMQSLPSLLRSSESHEGAAKLLTTPISREENIPEINEDFFELENASPHGEFEEGAGSPQMFSANELEEMERGTMKQAGKSLLYELPEVIHEDSEGEREDSLTDFRQKRAVESHPTLPAELPAGALSNSRTRLAEVAGLSHEHSIAQVSQGDFTELNEE